MNAQSASLFHISYRMERGDFVALAQVVAATPLPVVLLRVAIYFVLLLLLAVFEARFSLDGLVAVLSGVLSLPAAFLYVPLFSIVPLVLLGQDHVIALSAGATYRKSAIADRDIDLDLDVEGIEGGASDLGFRYAWGAVQRLVETPKHLFILVSKREAMIIPRRAVPNDDTWRNMLGFIRARTGLATR